MSLDLSGADAAIVAAPVSIDLGNQHPLIKLANALPSFWRVSRQKLS